MSVKGADVKLIFFMKINNNTLFLRNAEKTAASPAESRVNGFGGAEPIGNKNESKFVRKRSGQGNRLKSITLGMVVMLLGMTSFAQTIRYVKPTASGLGDGSSWANASANIQSMINASASGDQVWIAGGTYLLSATLEMKDGVNVYGGFAGTETTIATRAKSDLDANGTIEDWEFTNATILDGQNARRVLNQASNFAVETIWDGVTITKGRVVNSTGAATDAINGGGVYIRTNGKLINCIIDKNRLSCSNAGDVFPPNATLYAYGGGIYNNGGVVSQCMVSENTSYVSSAGGDPGGRAYSYGGGIYNNRGTVSYCMIKENTVASQSTAYMYFESYSTSSGGGVYNSEGTVSHCIVKENSVSSDASMHGYANSYGGGIYCVNTSNSFVNDCTIEYNEAIYGTNQGHGIYQGNVNRCIVQYNERSDVPSPSGSGGGMYGSYARNCLITNNSAASGGGAYDGTYINCTFAGNRSNNSNGGHGVCGSNSSQAIVTNCIFWGNQPTINSTYQATVTYSAMDYQIVSGVGNIRLYNNDFVWGSYYLQPTSPCINSGNNSAISDNIDLAGNPRIHGDTVDMGAYESDGIYRYIISGTVNTIPNSQVTITYNGGSVVTKAAAYSGYRIMVEKNTTVTLTPISAGYVFDPTSLTFGNITDNITMADFNGIACPASGNCGANGNNLTWEISCAGVLKITGNGDMANYAPTPSTPPPWNSYGDFINTVVISDGVTGIGNYAFFGFSSPVTIPNSVTSIGNYAFAYYGDTTITIPENITHIGDVAFWRCQNLRTVNYNAINCITMGSLYPSFYECDSLTTINIGNAVQSIPNYAFSTCKSLTSVTIPEGITSIGLQAFRYCSSLKSVTIPESITHIGDNAFSNCTFFTNGKF